MDGNDEIIIGADCCPYGPINPPIKLIGDTYEEAMHHFAVICKEIDMCNGK